MKTTRAVLTVVLFAGSTPSLACANDSPGDAPDARHPPGGGDARPSDGPPRPPPAGGDDGALPAWPDGARPDDTPVVLVGSGDMAGCSNDNDEATAALIDDIEGTVFTAGDNVYPDGTLKEFRDCYDPTWGRHKWRTRPTPGNHDYHTSGASGYFEYFGAAAGEPGKGWYSYDLGGWHIVALNSNCSEIGGCEAGSRQETWLREDLAQHPAACTLAYWHHPRFSYGQYGNDRATEDLWRALEDAGAEVVVTGHDHNYQRYAPQDATGQATPRGIRQFVIGIGGRKKYSLKSPPANAEAGQDHTYGILVFTLYPDRYDWRFVPVEGGTYTDSGSGVCH